MTQHGNKSLTFRRYQEYEEKSCLVLFFFFSQHAVVHMIRMKETNITMALDYL